MLTAFRTFAKSKWAIGLLVLLGIGLVVTGGSQMDVLANLGPKHVVSAGDRNMSQAEFRAELDRIREQAQQQAGRALTFEELIGEGGLRQYLQQKSQQLRARPGRPAPSPTFPAAMPEGASACTKRG